MRGVHCGLARLFFFIAGLPDSYLSLTNAGMDPRAQAGGYCPGLFNKPGMVSTALVGKSFLWSIPLALATAEDRFPLLLGRLLGSVGPVPPGTGSLRTLFLRG